jgi:thiamine-phosphate pyrophosphorylase
MRGLYAILDIRTLVGRRLDPLAFAGAVLAARPAAVQLRAKDLPPREILTLLRALSSLCRAAKVPLVTNDRADLAALTACDFVHVGQEDIPVELVRRIAPSLRVGVSTHNLEQLERALEARPAYVAYGPVFPTPSKTHPDPCVGMAGLHAAYAVTKKARVPLVAIGGITLEVAREVAGSADAAAVIGGLLPNDVEARVVLSEVTERARALHAALGGTPHEDEARA